MSGYRLGVGGVWANPANIRWGAPGGTVYVAPSRIYTGAGGSWVQVWSNYIPVGGSATGSTASYNLGNASTPINRAMSTQATAFPTGGNGAYTYAWSIVGTSGIISGATLGSTANQKICTVSATARLNQYSTVDLSCVMSDGTTSTTVTTAVNFNYYNHDGA